MGLHCRRRKQARQQTRLHMELSCSRPSSGSQQDSKDIVSAPKVDTLPILLPAVDTVDTHSASLPMLRTWWQGQSTEHLSISALLELDGGWTGIQEREEDKEAMRSPYPLKANAVRYLRRAWRG